MTEEKLPPKKNEKEITVSVMMPNDSPVIDDLVGESKNFADDLIMGLNAEQLYAMMGTSPDKIFMINGSPGTGKTYSILAINNSANSNVLEHLKNNTLTSDRRNPYGFKLFVVSYDIGTHGTAYINMGSRNVQKFFDDVYKMSRVSNVLVKLDEADALLTSRTAASHSHKEDDKVLETLMKNLQIAHDTPGVYVAMMTNLKERVDDAVLRAGRVDKHYTFSLPTYEDRQLLYDKIITGKNAMCAYDVIRKYDVQELADKSKGFNNADISTVVDKVLKEKVKTLIKNKTPGIIVAGYITQKGLLEQIEYHREEFKKESEKKRIGFI